MQCLRPNSSKTFQLLFVFILLNVKALKKIVGGDVAPNKVIEIKSDTVKNLPVLRRDESLVLYGPDPNDPNSRWEIVLLRPFTESKSTSFSLYRCQTEEGALIKYNAFLHRVPKLTSIVKEYYNVSGLQKLCDTLVKNPSWSVGHLVVHFNLTEYVKHKQMINLMDYPEKKMKTTRLQSAAKMRNKKKILNFMAAHSTVMFNHRVKALLTVGADINIKAYQRIEMSSKVLTHEGTPRHSTNPTEIIEALIGRRVQVNQSFSETTTLHLMVMHNRYDCVLALLSKGIDVDLRDTEGKTALHIAIEKKLIPIVQTLIVFGCDVNAAISKGNVTPRHMVGNATANGEDANILYILNSVGANRCPITSTTCPSGCNSTGTYNGIPPQVPESHGYQKHFRQMLTSYVFDMIQKLQKNQKILNHSRSIAKTEVIASSTMKGSPSEPISIAAALFHPSDYQKQQASTSTSVNSQDENRGRLLCLDGGGIRCLVLIQMLLEIEKLSKTPIRNMFDWMAGTGAGGILALGLGMGRSVKELLGLYLMMKDHITVGSRPYTNEMIENLLIEFFGTNSVTTDNHHPKIMVKAINTERTAVRFHLIRNYEYASGMDCLNKTLNKDSPDMLLNWETTNIALSHFKDFKQILDAELITKNPTLEALTEIHEYNEALKSVGRVKEAVPVSVVLSLGTGLTTMKKQMNSDIFKPNMIWETLKVVLRLTQMKSLIMDQEKALNERVEEMDVDRAKAWCSMTQTPYYRFDPPMSEEVPMDEKDYQKLINMMWKTKAYMHENKNKINDLISLLKMRCG